MPHHGNTSIHDCCDLVGHVDAALKFDAVAACFLDHADGIGHRLLTGNLIGTERHIANDKGVRSSLYYWTDMMDHVVHGYCRCSLVAKHDHA